MHKYKQLKELIEYLKNVACYYPDFKEEDIDAIDKILCQFCISSNKEEIIDDTLNQLMVIKTKINKEISTKYDNNRIISNLKNELNDVLALDDLTIAYSRLINITYKAHKDLNKLDLVTCNVVIDLVVETILKIAKKQDIDLNLINPYFAPMVVYKMKEELGIDVISLEECLTYSKDIVKLYRNTTNKR